jgi:hypothetical protein
MADKSNGHAPDAVASGDDISLAEAGGLWTGANLLKAHLEQVTKAQQAQAAINQIKARWQIEVSIHRGRADAAQAKMAECFRSADHEGAAKAARALTVACLHLIRLGAE